MNNLGISTSAIANAAIPASSIGKQAVGLENVDAKQDVLAPVEEAAGTSAALDHNHSASSESPLAQQQERYSERLDEQQQKQQLLEIRELAARDREVRAHEQAHAAVGGQYAGSPSYTFQRGPDGVNYAVGGEVPISLPSGGDPRAAIAAAEQVRRAALAPADPSAQDRRIAAAATEIANQARAELAAIALQETLEGDEDDPSDDQQPTVPQVDKQYAANTEKGNLEAREQRLAEIRAASLKGSQLSEQLTALDNIQNQRSAGSVLDQLA